jgi:RND family efflux transporter MFP subunit
MSFMSRHSLIRRFSPACRAIAASTVLAMSALGCNDSAKAELPPAVGAGAPPLPELPQVTPKVDHRERAGTGTSRVTGTLYPREQAQVATKIAGTLTRVAVDQGDRVKKGALLFQVDSRDAALHRDQAAAQVKAAEVSVQAVKVELDRARSLLKQNALNQVQFDQVQVQYEAAQVGLEQAKIAHSMAQKALADTAVRAPIAGTITAKLKNDGEAVAAMPPTVVVVIEDYSAVELRFRIPETELPRVKEGDEVSARFAALGTSRSATIQRVNPTIDALSRTAEVVAVLDNQDLTLKPGMLAEVSLAKPAAAGTPSAELGAAGGQAQGSGNDAARGAKAAATGSVKAQP